MFATDNSGVFWGLASLMVIVFVGIGISELTQRRFEFSSSSKGDQLAIQTDAAHLAELTDEKQTLEGRLDRVEKPSREQSGEMAEIQGTIRTQQAKVDELKAAVAARQSAYNRSADGFVAYRAQIRKDAIGEKIPVVRVRSGREYRDVTMMEVTPIGLKITHADGTARLDSNDLDDSWQQRFQWDENERKAMLEAQKERPSIDNTPPPLSAPVRTSTTDDDILKLRNELMGWNNQVSQLDAQHAEARMKIAASGSPSVPGSLETWVARANRLGVDLDRARTNQLRARARLAAVAPNDLLLRVR